METVVLFLVGLVIGSFLNVLIYRLNTTNRVPKFWQGRSICPNCKHELAWIDNIPLVSYVLLHGQCRYCHQAINWHYPVVELTTVVATVFVFNFSPAFLPVAYVFIVIFFSDLIYGLIPDEMIVLGSLIAAVVNADDLASYLLSGATFGLGFLLIVILTKFRGMGLGDVKLAFMMGVLLGWPKMLIAIWLAFILGGIFTILLLFLKKVRFSDTIALGPFLVLGVAISALWSSRLLRFFGF